MRGEVETKTGSIAPRILGRDPVLDYRFRSREAPVGYNKLAEVPVIRNLICRCAVTMLLVDADSGMAQDIQVIAGEAAANALKNLPEVGGEVAVFVWITKHGMTIEIDNSSCGSMPQACERTAMPCNEGGRGYEVMSGLAQGRGADIGYAVDAVEQGSSITRFHANIPRSH